MKRNIKKKTKDLNEMWFLKNFKGNPLKFSEQNTITQLP